MPFSGEILSLTPFDAPDVVDFDEEETPSWGVSALQAFNREYLPINGMRIADRMMETFKEDPSFNGWNFLADNIEQFKDILPELEDNPQRVNEAVSQEHLMSNIDRLRYEKEMTEQANANGLLPYIVGGAAAAALDPFTWLSVGAIEKAFRGLGAASRVGRFITMGAAGALEQGVSEIALQAGQDLRTSGESLSAVALSGILSGAVGAMLGNSPVKTGKSYPELYNKSATELAEVVPDNMAGREMMGSSLSTPTSAGAAAYVPGGSEPISGTRGSWVTRHALNSWTPLGRAVNTITEWTEHLRGSSNPSVVDFADAAVRNHWSVVERLMDTHLLTKENMMGVPTVSAEARRGFYRTWAVRTAINQREIYNKTMKEIGQSSSSFNPQTWRGIREGMFDLDVGSYRLAKEGGVGDKWVPLPKDKSGGDFLATPELRQKYINGVKEASDNLDKFFKDFADKEIKYGLLTEEDIKEGYYRHRYDVAAIRLDPDEFKALLRERFMKYPNDQWCIENYGKKFDDMTPDEKAVVYDEWSTDLNDKAVVGAQQSMADAAKVITRGKATIDELNSLKTEAGREKLKTKIKEARAAATARRAEIEKWHETIELRRIRTEKYKQKLAELEAKPIPKTPEAREKLAKRIGQAQGVIEESERWIKAKQARAEKLTKELLTLENKLTRAEVRVNQAKHFMEIVNRDFRKTVSMVAKAKQKFKKAEKTLKAISTKPDLDTIVDNTFNAITNHHTNPFGFLPDDVVNKSGCLKARQINWGEMLGDARLQKFLVVRPEKIVSGYTEDMGARLALIETFGDDAMKDVLSGPNGVYTLYEQAIEQARKAGDEKTLSYLQDAYHNAHTDITDLRDMFLGRFGVGENPNEAVLYFSKQARSVNFLRTMGRVLFSSLTDPVTVVAATDKNLIDFTVQAIQYIKNFGSKIPSKELRRIVDGMEVSRAYNRQLTTWGLDDYIRAGEGIGHGTTRKVTGFIDDFNNTLTNALNYANLMLPWNKAMRNIGGELFLGKAADELPQFAKLSTKQIGKWARLGIDQDMAERISILFQKYSDHVDGRVYPKMEKWLLVDPEAHRAFTQALNTLMNEALIVPGLGDLPKFMSHWAGKLLLQFQSFNFATVSRYTRPLMQRAWGNHEAGFVMMNIISGLSLGLLGYIGRVYLAGASSKHFDQQLNDLKEGKNLNLLWEMFLRSPLPGPSAMPAEFFGKVGGASINKAINKNFGIPGFFPGTASRTAERSAATTLLGPSFGTFETAVSMGSHIAGMADPDSDTGVEARKAIRDFIRLLPFQNLWLLSMGMKYAQENGIIPPLVE